MCEVRHNRNEGRELLSQRGIFLRHNKTDSDIVSTPSTRDGEAEHRHLDAFRGSSAE